MFEAPSRSIPSLGTYATLGLLELLRDPEPGTRGFWAALSNRGRGWVRLVIGLLFLFLLAGVSLGAEHLLGPRFMPSDPGRIIFGIVLPFFGFGGIYILAWGVLCVITGKGHAQIAPLPRLLFFGLFAVMGFGLMMYALMTGVWTKQLLSSQFLLSFRAGYSDLRAHVETIDRLRETETCEDAKLLEAEIEKIEDGIASNPTLESFEFALDRADTATTHQRTLYNLSIVRNLREDARLRCNRQRALTGS